MAGIIPGQEYFREVTWLILGYACVQGYKGVDLRDTTMVMVELFGQFGGNFPERVRALVLHVHSSRSGSRSMAAHCGW